MHLELRPCNIARLMTSDNNHYVSRLLHLRLPRVCVAITGADADELIEKAEVDINLLIGRAVERPRGGFGTAATRLRIVPEQHQLRAAVGRAGFRQQRPNCSV